MKYSELLTDDSAFSALRDGCNTLFDATQRLPGQVFRRSFAEYHAFEHGQIFRNDFAMFLASVARNFNDKIVNYMTLDPDPIEYYKKNCGFYGLASFEATTLMDNYLKVMYRDGNVDSFRARGGDVAVIWGSSSEWGIFCDRRSWELCVMGSSARLDDSIMLLIGSMNTTHLKDYILNQYQNNRPVALDFLQELTKNYPTLG